MFTIKGKELGIDLGTANSRVFTQGRGLTVEEATVVAMDTKNQEIIAFGKKADDMLGRTPDGIFVAHPLVEGVISDFDLAEAYLRYLMEKADPGLHLIRPRVTVSVPTLVTDVERRAIEDACIQAGAGEAVLVDEPLAAATGAFLPVNGPRGSMVLSMGAGSTECAVLSLGGIVSSRSTVVAGRFFDTEIMRHFRDAKELLIGDQMAEQIKIQLGACLPGVYAETMEVHGRDLRTGMPRITETDTAEVYDIIMPHMGEIVDVVISTLETTPPELSRDILDRGMILTGGMAGLRGVRDFLEEAIRIPVRIAEEPMRCVVYGCAADFAPNVLERRQNEPNSNETKA